MVSSNACSYFQSTCGWDVIANVPALFLSYSSNRIALICDEACIICQNLKGAILRSDMFMLIAIFLDPKDSKIINI